jgi:tRNA C32,U32 (ribose-2'-O)-methylase TrmJ
MWLTDEEQRKLLDTTGPITEKISKAVQSALKALQFGALRDDIDKVYKLAERLDKRQKAQVQAELRSLSARAATYKSNIDADD